MATLKEALAGILRQLEKIHFLLPLVLMLKMIMNDFPDMTVSTLSSSTSSNRKLPKMLLYKKEKGWHNMAMDILFMSTKTGEDTYSLEQVISVALDNCRW